MLVPASWPDYDRLLKEIQPGLEAPSARAARSETSAILINRSDKPVVALCMTWLYEETDGRKYSGSWTQRSTSGQAILPGSVRCIRDPDGKSTVRTRTLQSVTLTLDGAFFGDGEFVGPNRAGLWERVTERAHTRLAVALAARNARDRGMSSADVLKRVTELTGAAPSSPPRPPRPPRLWTDTPSRKEVQHRELQMRAWEIELRRQTLSDEQTVEWLVSETDTVLPNLRKR